MSGRDWPGIASSQGSSETIVHRSLTTRTTGGISSMMITDELRDGADPAVIIDQSSVVNALP